MERAMIVVTALALTLAGCSPAGSESTATGGVSPIEVTHQGRTGTTEFSTTDDSATCLTDLRLT